MGEGVEERAAEGSQTVAQRLDDGVRDTSWKLRSVLVVVHCLGVLADHGQPFVVGTVPMSSGHAGA